MHAFLGDVDQDLSVYIVDLHEVRELHLVLVLHVKIIIIQKCAFVLLGLDIVFLKMLLIGFLSNVQIL